MNRLKFWKTPPPEPETTTEAPSPIEVAPRAEGFRAPPPRDAHAADSMTPAMARRSELIDAITQIQTTVADSAYWTERVAPIQQALEHVEADLRGLQQIDRSRSVSVPPFAVAIDRVETGPPARVIMRINGSSIEFEEEIDWSERGHQIVRPELERKGNPDGIVYPGTLGTTGLESAFDAGLFALATDLRDRALQGESLPDSVESSQVLSACPICGGPRLWNGICLSCEERRVRLHGLSEERKRLLDQRDDVLQEREQMSNELPLLKRRLADINRTIEAN